MKRAVYSLFTVSLMLAAGLAFAGSAAEDVVPAPPPHGSNLGSDCVARSRTRADGVQAAAETSTRRRAAARRMRACPRWVGRVLLPHERYLSLFVLAGVPADRILRRKRPLGDLADAVLGSSTRRVRRPVA